MKKMLINACALLLISNSIFAGDGDPKKIKGGLRITPQPTWFSVNSKNMEKYKAGFGFGFGMSLDFRCTDVIYFSTGLGGDFEGGTVKYHDYGMDPKVPSTFTLGANQYITDKSLAFVEAKDNVQYATTFDNNTVNFIDSRKVKTTHITIPLMLKMLTNEYSGIKYFGTFGGELGIRVGAKANDKYRYQVVNGVSTSTVPPVITTGGENKDLNINGDAALFPIRVGMNVGAGIEYRLGGTTALLFSINYFKAFTNLMKIHSDNIYTEATTDAASGKVDFKNSEQNIKMNAIRINIGFMF